MKIFSWNVNGLASIFEKGFFDFLKNFEPDIFALQEIKFKSLSEFKIGKYFVFMNSAKGKGFWGTAIFSKIEPKRIEGGNWL